MNLQKEYERVYRNYQICLAAFENIIRIAMKTDNFEIAKEIKKAITQFDTNSTIQDFTRNN